MMTLSPEVKVSKPRKPRSYTLSEVGAKLGVDIKQVKAWRRAGYITADPELSYPKQQRYNVDEIDTLIAKGVLPPVEEFVAERPKPPVKKSNPSISNKDPFNIPHDSPLLIHHAGHSLLPEHFKRFIRIHEEYKSGIRKGGGGSTLGDRLTNVGRETVPFHFNMKAIRQLLQNPLDEGHRWEDFKLPPKERKKYKRVKVSKPRRPRSYSASDVGRLLGVDVEQVKAWRKAGYITVDPELSYPSQRFYNADEIDRLIAEGVLPPVTELETTPPVAEVETNEIDAKVSESITDTSHEIAVPFETQIRMSETYTAKQVADLCSTSPQVVGTWRRHLYIPDKACIRAGTYCKEEIDRMLAEGELPPKGTVPKQKPSKKERPADVVKDTDDVLPSDALREFVPNRRFTAAVDGKNWTGE